ncbi:MAG: M20 metallopeptidase family protein [Bacillota bacterium]
MKREIKEAIDNLEEEIIRWRRAIHKEPELGFAEHKTAAKIIDILTATDLEVQSGIAQTGVVANLRLDEQLPTLALRADMDALPINEETDVEYTSEIEGVMHACGHDGHVAILLGTAVILNQFRDKLDLNLRFIFQPAEEGPGGAKPMIEAGVLDGVDGIVGLHLNTDDLIGEIEIKEGAFSAAVDQIRLSILGAGGHGAAPHQTVDAISIAAQVINSLQTIVSRRIDPQQSVVLSLGKINGGYRHNVIADQVDIEGTVRTIDPEIREELPQMIEDIISGIVHSQQADYKLEYESGYPILFNDAALVDQLERTFQATAEIEQVTRVDNPSMGAEDFAYYCQEVPGAFYRLGAGKFPDCSYPGHHPQFNFDERALKLGVISMVEVVLNHNLKQGEGNSNLE